MPSDHIEKNINANMTSKAPPSVDEKYKSEEPVGEGVHAENVSETVVVNLGYDDDEHEPEIHARTYYALTAMFLLNLVQVLALQGPPAVVCALL